MSVIGMNHHEYVYIILQYISSDDIHHSPLVECCSSSSSSEPPEQTMKIKITLLKISLSRPSFHCTAIPSLIPAHVFPFIFFIMRDIIVNIFHAVIKTNLSNQ